MPGGTLVVSRDVNVFPFYKKKLEAYGFRGISFTDTEKDGLNMIINERNPRLVLIGSRFYEAGTSVMVGQIMRSFTELNIAVINIKGVSVKYAPYFIWRKAKSYADFGEGEDEFDFGMKEINKGNAYISPSVNKIINSYEGPELKDKADDRQMEVLIFLANGRKPEEIGKMLHVSRRTIDWHIAELCKVFDSDNREELISTVISLGIVTRDDMRFFDRKIKGKELPNWAVLKMNLGVL